MSAQAASHAPAAPSPLRRLARGAVFVVLAAAVTAALVFAAHRVPARVKLIGIFPAVVGLLIGLGAGMLVNLAQLQAGHRDPRAADRNPDSSRRRASSLLGWPLFAALLLGAAGHAGLSLLDHHEYVAHLDASGPDLRDLPPELRAEAPESEQSELLGHILLHEALESADPETRALAEEQLRRFEERRRERAQRRTFCAFLAWRLENVRPMIGGPSPPAAWTVWAIEGVLAAVAAGCGVTLVRRRSTAGSQGPAGEGASASRNRPPQFVNEICPQPSAEGRPTVADPHPLVGEGLAWGDDGRCAPHPHPHPHPSLPHQGEGFPGA